MCAECDVHARCIHGKCICKEGYEGDGYSCQKGTSDIIPILITFNYITYMLCIHRCKIQGVKYNEILPKLRLLDH